MLSVIVGPSVTEERHAHHATASAMPPSYVNSMVARVISYTNKALVSNSDAILVVITAQSHASHYGVKAPILLRRHVNGSAVIGMLFGYHYEDDIVNAASWRQYYLRRRGERRLSISLLATTRWLAIGRTWPALRQSYRKYHDVNVNTATIMENMFCITVSWCRRLPV